MTTLHHHDLSFPIPLSLAPSDAGAPILSYNMKTAPEAALFKTLAGFGLGSVLMGLMLNAGAFMLLNRMSHLWQAKFEFILRGAFLMGLTFVGTSLLLVALKAREDKSTVPLHSKHWMVSLITGASFAMAVFGPGLVAERGLPLNTWGNVAVWMAVLVVPIAASFWLVTRQQSRVVMAGGE